MTSIDGFLDILTWVNAFYTNFNFKLKDDKGNPLPKANQVRCLEDENNVI